MSAVLYCCLKLKKGGWNYVKKRKMHDSEWEKHHWR